MQCKTISNSISLIFCVLEIYRISAKFGIGTVVSVNWTLVEAKMFTLKHILASSGVTVTLAMLHVPNLALTHTKRITVRQKQFRLSFRQKSTPRITIRGVETPRCNRCGEHLSPRSKNRTLLLELHCKKKLSIFPSPAGKSLTKLSLDGNNLIISVQGDLG